MRSWAALSLLLVGQGCTTIPDVVLSFEDAELLCDVMLNVRPTGYNIATGNGARGGEFPAEVREMSRRTGLKPLPNRLECGSERLVLDPPASRNFHQGIWDYWISEDRQQIALGGGYVAAQLTGGTGICTYRRIEAGWSLGECITTSVI